MRFGTPPVGLVFALGVLGLGTTALAQESIEVPLDTASALVGLGPGGMPPTVITSSDSPSGKAISGLQPASYGEWKVTCQTPGLYRIRLSMGQWQDPKSVLAFETRPYSVSDDLYATRYATPDTKDYGQTLGPSTFYDLGDVEDGEGNVLTVPLWAGDNVLRVQNVSGRHNPAYTYPTDPMDRYNRDWDFYWSNINIGRIVLIRDGDLPAFGTITGRVSADRPADYGVRRAIVTANPLDASPPEPSQFWKNGYYTYTQDDGTYTLRAPAGPRDVKAGRPSGYQVQGSPAVTVDVPDSGTAPADLQLANAFRSDGQGNQTIALQCVYADSRIGTQGLLAVDGENGYKMGWIDLGDANSMLVDVPRTGYYRVASFYFNGGSDGTVRVSTDRGASVQGVQPAMGGWAVPGTLNFSQTLYLVQGTNVITETLVGGASDMNAVHLTIPAVTFSDASRALRIAAGLLAAGPDDTWQGTLVNDPSITLADAVRIAQAAAGRPL